MSQEFKPYEDLDFEDLPKEMQEELSNQKGGDEE